MSDRLPDAEPDLNYILQTDLLETPNLTIKVVKESPVDGISYQESYSDPCLVINFGAKLKTFEVVGNKTNGYKGAVIPGDFSFLPPGSLLEGYYQGIELCYAYIMFSKQRLDPRFAEKMLIMESDSLIQSLELLQENYVLNKPNRTKIGVNHDRRYRVIFIKLLVNLGGSWEKWESAVERGYSVEYLKKVLGRNTKR
ncbi:MAG: hypothetical protein AB4368_24525 [Xenococcaceae cyanobacterium]